MSVFGVAAAAAVVLSVVAVPRGAVASTPPAYGHDISWPQCPAGTGHDVGGGYGIGQGNPMPPTTTDFVVIGLTAGLPFTTNPCLQSQVRWALDHQVPRAAYTMTAYPTNAQLAAYGGAGPKPGSTLADRLYNTGYAMAVHDRAVLRQLAFAVPWVWIDVEPRRVQNWPANNTTNSRAVLAGVSQGFVDGGFATGWYSVRSAWADITGNWQDGKPMWKAGDYTSTGYPGARSICSTPSLNHGPIWLGQRVDGRYDLDATCDALPSLATVFAGVAPSLAPIAAAPPWAAPGGQIRFSTVLGTTQQWAATLSNACTGATVRTWSGVAKGPIAVPWDGTDASGVRVPAGEYAFQVTSSSITRSATVELSTPGRTPLAGCSAERVYGADRYATSVEVGHLAAAAGHVVVVASGATTHLVDGLVAAPLAHLLAAPLLLVPSDAARLAGLLASVTADLSARQARTAYVAGGTGAVSDRTLGLLRAAGVTTVLRMSGADRYATAAAVARTMAAHGGALSGRAWVASGSAGHLVDALAAGGPAASAAEPVLLTAATAVPPATAAGLRDLNVGRTLVLGGPASIADSVLASLPGPARVFGADRWATATAIAAFAPAGAAGVLTSGDDAHLVDALGAGTLARPVVLTAGTALPTATASWLSGHRGLLFSVVGGPASIAPAVVVAGHAA